MQNSAEEQGFVRLWERDLRENSDYNYSLRLDLSAEFKP